MIFSLNSAEAPSAGHSIANRVERRMVAAPGSGRPGHPARESFAAFTLVELLVVIGVMAAMMALAIPAFNALRGDNDYISEIYDIAGTLEQARVYAMSNNTYVLIGIGEFNASQSTSAKPQTPGTGRLAIAMISSADGTRPYQNLLLNNGSGFSGWSTQYGTGKRFSVVTKLANYQNIHLVDLQSGTPPLATSGNMARTAVLPSYDLSTSGTTANSGTPFAWPLGTGLTGTPQAQYTFNKVIEFDPKGSARIISSSNLAAIPYCIEIGLEPAFGSAAPTPSSGSSGQIAAIQIDGMSGATRIYRP